MSSKSLKSGDVVLVKEAGWGLIPGDENKYVELVNFHEQGYFGSPGWTIRGYGCVLATKDPGCDGYIGVESFGENPKVMFNNTETWENVRVAIGSKQEVDKALGIDRGKHYRYAFRLNLTQEDIENGFVTVNIDPYRISEVYNLGGWREHLVKKAIRGTEKGHTEVELLEELQCTLDRAKQMLEESRE